MVWTITLKSGEQIVTTSFTVNENNVLVIWHIPNVSHYSGRTILVSDIECVDIN